MLRRTGARRRRRVPLGFIALVAVGAVLGAGLALGTGAQAGRRALDGMIAGGTYDAVRVLPGAPVASDAGDAVLDGGSTGEALDDDVRPPAPTPKPAPPTPTPGPTPGPTPQRRDDPDPMSAKYNPYVTEGDVGFVPEDVRRQWLGEQEVIRDCMREAGFEYLPWQWWYGGSPQPADQTDAEAAAWMRAYAGSASARTKSVAGEVAPGGETAPPSGDAAADGCRGAGRAAAEAAREAGAPLSGEPLPAPAPDEPTERERWLGFQDEVRACMATAGLEYRYWQYWNPIFTVPEGGLLPAEPEGLDDAARTAWRAALYGHPAADGTPSGGCWDAGLAASGYRTFT